MADGDAYTCDCTRTGYYGVNCETGEEYFLPPTLLEAVHNNSFSVILTLRAGMCVCVGGWGLELVTLMKSLL